MNIIVAVSGSIASYKAFDVVRGLTKTGHKVRVILTQGAHEFVKPEVFKHLGAEFVYQAQDDHHPSADKFEGLDSSQVLHIALARWAQKFIAAPLTANSLNKLGQGLADDLLSCLFLAMSPEIPKLIFPAMNPAMWENQIVKKSRSTLSEMPMTYLHSTLSGEMVCGENGDGKLATVEEILALTQSFKDKPRQDKILITTGATISPLDPVRYLTNNSSGETGYWLAVEALKMGFKVHLIAGEKATLKLNLLIDHPRFQLERVQTTEQMLTAVTNSFDECKAYISSAAIGDISFQTQNEKIKKDKITNSLPIIQAPDILKTILQKRKAHQTIVGFAAETDLSLPVLHRKWSDKQVDLLVGTKVGFSEGFGDKEANYIFYRGNDSTDFEGNLSKSELAQKIMELIDYDQTHSVHV